MLILRIGTHIGRSYFNFSLNKNAEGKSVIVYSLFLLLESQHTFLIRVFSLSFQFSVNLSIGKEIKNTH